MHTRTQVYTPPVYTQGSPSPASLVTALLWLTDVAINHGAPWCRGKIQNKLIKEKHGERKGERAIHAHRSMHCSYQQSLELEFSAIEVKPSDCLKRDFCRCPSGDMSSVITSFCH